MAELPELITISSQIEDALIGKRIIDVVNATSPHKFAWYHGDPLKYGELLIGRTVESSKAQGMFVDIYFDSDVKITIGDGTNIRYFRPFEPHPKKHQLLIVFDDACFVTFTVSMYGAIFAYKGVLENPYYRKSINRTSPLDDAFDEKYFDDIFESVKKSISVKALLATEQRIPGLGNGVLQDILFNAGINPKRKISSITDFEKKELYHSLKTTLRSMTEKGGRDSQKDIFGNKGKYKSILSSSTYKNPCPNCGSEIIKEAYMGGSVYYCNHCQKL